MSSHILYRHPRLTQFFRSLIINSLAFREGTFESRSSEGMVIFHSRDACRFRILRPPEVFLFPGMSSKASGEDALEGSRKNVCRCFMLEMKSWTGWGRSATSQGKNSKPEI